jgi:hypothetical protein
VAVEERPEYVCDPELGAFLWTSTPEVDPFVDQALVLTSSV